jgi:hypothetical protein
MHKDKMPLALLIKTVLEGKDLGKQPCPQHLKNLLEHYRAAREDGRKYATFATEDAITNKTVTHHKGYLHGFAASIALYMALRRWASSDTTYLDIAAAFDVLETIQGQLL